MSWLEFYDLAKKYFEINGNIDFPYSFKTSNGISYDKNGYEVGEWKRKQKIYFKKGSLDNDKIKLMEQLNFDFNSRMDNWNFMFNLATKYYEKYGNIRIHKLYKTFDGINYDLDGYNLGDWIKEQRKRYVGTSKIKDLTDDQINKLNSLGMIWDVNDEDWEFMYALAEEYYEKHGHLKVKRGIKSKGQNLGEWIKTQRSSKEFLSKDRTKRLEDIGMIWNWENNCNRVKAYCDISNFEYDTSYSYIPYEEFVNKFEYAIKYGLNVRQILFMSNKNIQAKYGYVVEEFIKKTKN